MCIRDSQLILYDSITKKDGLIRRRLDNLENQCQRLEIENIELKNIINDSRNKQQIFLNQMESIFQTFYKACNDANVPGLDNFAKSLIENAKLLNNDTTKQQHHHHQQQQQHDQQQQPREWDLPEWIESDDINLTNQSSTTLCKVNSLNSDSGYNCFSRLSSLEDWDGESCEHT